MRQEEINILNNNSEKTKICVDNNLVIANTIF